MALFNRQKSNDVPEELQPYYEAPANGANNWLTWLLRAVLLAIAIFLLVLFVRWVWHQTHVSTTSKKPGQSTSQGQSPSNGNGNSQPNANNSPTDTSQQPPGSATTGPPTSTGSNATTNQPANSGKLTNSGPGDVVGLFAAATLGGVALYQLRLRKKLTS